MACSTADKINAVETYIAGYGKGDIDMIMSVFSDTATVEDPVGTEPFKGKAAIRDFMTKGIAMDVRLSLLGSIRCAGDCAAFPFTVSLNYDGRHTKIEVIDVFTFDDHGRVKEMRAYFGPDNMKAV